LKAEAGTAVSPWADPSRIDGRPTVRLSRLIRVRARFRTIENSQVVRLDRPSNRPIPEKTASQASWTTSSACALLPMIDVATWVNVVWNRRINAR